MFNLVAASAYFLLIHFAVSGTRLRDALVARLGEGPYRGAFSFASLIGLVWLIYAYRHASTVHLWDQPLGLRPIAFMLVLFAFLLGVIGLATPSPTQVGMESKLANGTDIARGMVRITRHPFLCGVALWALVHLIMNGDRHPSFSSARYSCWRSAARLPLMPSGATASGAVGHSSRNPPLLSHSPRS